MRSSKNDMRYRPLSGDEIDAPLFSSFIRRQEVTLCLRRIGGGAFRLHGGGFAGVIMCVIPKAETAGYVDYMAGYFGRENVYLTNIRQTGAACLGKA